MTAVRAGLRVALSRASSPVAWPRRWSGQPTTPPAGARRSARCSATPTNTSSEPSPIAVSRLVAGPPPNRPWSEEREAGERRPAPVSHRRRRPRGGVAQRLLAHRRDRRRPGWRARPGPGRRRSVTPIPTVRPTTIVRGARCMPPRGMPQPAASKSAPSAAREAQAARAGRAIDAMTPSTRASAATAREHLAAASRRSSAAARTRACAGPRRSRRC